MFSTIPYRAKEGFRSSTVHYGQCFSRARDYISASCVSPWLVVHSHEKIRYLTVQHKNMVRTYDKKYKIRI